MLACMAGPACPALAAQLDDTVREHEAVFRWFEERRLGQAIETWSAYESAGIFRTPTPKKSKDALLNVARNLRLYGRVVSWTTLFRSPKDRLVGAFPQVLFGPSQEGNGALRRIGVRVGGLAARKEFLRRWH